MSEDLKITVSDDRRTIKIELPKGADALHVVQSVKRNIINLGLLDKIERKVEGNYIVLKAKGGNDIVNVIAGDESLKVKDGRKGKERINELVWRYPEKSIELFRQWMEED